MLVSWNSTNQCNMFCDHCYRDAGAKWDDELNTDQAKKMIREIQAAGFKIMIFSGGESIMRPDIFELGSYATATGLRAVLGTNGTLITPDIAARLKTAGFKAAGVSLDSLDAGKNDQFRKFDKAHDLAIQGMINLKNAGVPFQIHTTVMDWNVGELEEITDFAIEIGAMAHHVFFLVPTGRAVNMEDEALRKVEYERTITRLMKKQTEIEIEIKPTCAPQFMRIAQQKNMPMRFSRGCLAGISYCIISPTGHVQPCAYLDIAVGNVKEKPFDEIWRDSQMFKELRTMAYEGKCGYCDYIDSCGGCRARAYYYTQGNYMAQDDWCLYQPRGENK